MLPCPPGETLAWCHRRSMAKTGWPSAAAYRIHGSNIQPPPHMPWTKMIGVLPLSPGIQLPAIPFGSKNSSIDCNVHLPFLGGLYHNYNLLVKYVKYGYT